MIGFEIVKVTLSGILRRILHVSVLTRQIRFAFRENKNHFRLRIPQINIDFADYFQADGPISQQADSIETMYDSF
jgi:hypothetical protein